MNFYALNEAPVNGWATRFGHGSALLEMQGGAEAANVQLGRGIADISISAGASITPRRMGYGRGDVVVSADGSGRRGATGIAYPSIEIQSTALGRRGAVASGAGDIQISADAEPRVVPPTGGIANIEITTSAAGRVPVTHHGFADALIAIELDATRTRSVAPVMGKADIMLWVTAGAKGNTIASGARADASVAIEAVAKARLGAILHASGEARIELETWMRPARTQQWVRGSATADIAIELENRDARTVTLPATYVPAPKQRVIRLATENRGMRVPKNAREIEAMEA
jgi:hypothetical protein